MLLNFKKFCLQESISSMSTFGTGTVVYQSWDTPSFQISIIDREAVAQELEPKDTILKKNKLIIDLYQIIIVQMLKI